jgi:hypothetical protein
VAVCCEEINGHSEVIKAGGRDFLDMLRDNELRNNYYARGVSRKSSQVNEPIGCII